MRAGAGRPLWLAAPSRYAGRSRQRARWLLALLVLLMLASLAALNVDSTADEHGAATLYELVVEDLRHGADYYTATANTLRIHGEPLHPFTAIRLPTLAVIQSRMSPVVAALFLYALALATLLVWWQRLGDALPRLLPRAIATLLAAIGMTGAVAGEWVALQDIWAGLLIALSLAARRSESWVTAAALALSAMLIRETAALYAVVMAAAALVEGRRREALGWGIAIGLFAAIFAFHAQAVAAVVRPLDQPAATWIWIQGFGFAVHSVIVSSGLALAPAVLGALAVGLALAGWAAWRDPLATRALATLLGYLLLLSFVSRPGDGDWAFLITPILPIGLAFLPDAMRDLIRTALDRRRITVTRTAS